MCVRSVVREYRTGSNCLDILSVTGREQAVKVGSMEGAEGGSREQREGEGSRRMEQGAEGKSGGGSW